MDEKVFLTQEGYQNIKEELDTLKNKTRPNVVDRLALARQQGDLSENSEYTSARDDLSFIDGRIEELENIIKNAVVVEEKEGPKGEVCLGCKVTVKTNGNETVYHIVGEWEANPAQKKVSHTSPLGQALIGRKAGEEVEFEAPAGKIVFNIVKID